MNMLINIEAGIQIKLSPELELDDVLELVKEEGGQIGKVTLRKLLSGDIESASGFELVELDESKAVEEISDEAAELAALFDKQEQEEAKPEPQPEPTPEPQPEPVKEESTPTPMAGSLAASLLGTDGKVNKDLAVKPEEKSGAQRRRHTKKNDGLELGYTSEHGEWIKLLEKEFPVQLNYVHPDFKWFHLTFTKLIANPEKITRKDAFIDISRTKNGGFGFSLYVGGKSACKRIKFKKSETEAETLAELVQTVKTAIAAWESNGVLK